MNPLFTHVVRLGLLVIVLCAPAWAAPDPVQLYKLKPGATGNLCLTCHPTFKETMALPFLHTPLKRGDCTGCHNPHASAHGKMLAADVKEVCFTCHQKLLPAKPLSTHKVVADGECSKCHDPHGAANQNNLLKVGKDLCLGCHKPLADRLGSAKFVHSPVKTGCQACHLPHASDKGEALLKNTVNPLCASCHKTDQPQFARRHMNYPVATARCTSCHDPHASNQPRLLSNTVHAPVANRLCNQCHEEGSVKTKKSGSDLCRGCHSDMYNRTFAMNRVHWPLVGKDACLSCHAPHAGKEKGLLKEPLARLCFDCHDDARRKFEKAQVKHEPVKSGECTACHDPHASNSLFLFNKPNELDVCGVCHDWAQHSTHPIGEKYRDPRNKNVVMTCRSCHQSHATEYLKLLLAPTVSQLCVQCHEQYKR